MNLIKLTFADGVSKGRQSLSMLLHTIALLQKVKVQIRYFVTVKLY